MEPHVGGLMTRQVRSREGARAKLKESMSVARRFDNWRPSAEVLTSVRSLPTIFPQFDRASRVGGYPLQRYTTVHGPSTHGKTQFVIGLCKSFIASGNIAAYVDAEFTTADDWVRKLLADDATNPNFLAMRPHSFEQTTRDVRELLEGVAADREAGKLAPETTVLVVIDSIRKLVPERLMAKIAKNEGGVDGASGRAAQYRAALNAQWLDELTPLLYHKNAAMVFVARETEDSDGNFKVGGGASLIYDASMLIRILRASWITETNEKESPVVGEAHRVIIHKSKVAGLDGRFTSCMFHTSNGKLSPEGFDRPRDVVQLAGQLGIVTLNGSWYSFGKERLGQGMNKTLARLQSEPGLLNQIEAQVRGEGLTDEEQGPETDAEKAT